jgi:hypothetical protein
MAEKLKTSCTVKGHLWPEPVAPERCLCPCYPAEEAGIKHLRFVELHGAQEKND